MQPGSRNLLIILVVIIAAAGGYWFLTRPDERTPTEKLGDAIHDIDKGPTRAARQLQSRTPGQKLGDAIKDTGEDVKENTQAP